MTRGKRPSGQKRDFMQVARAMVEESIGEHMDGTPVEPVSPKSKRAAGGKKGGPARARSLTAEQRRQIAEKAARARWKLECARCKPPSAIAFPRQ